MPFAQGHPERFDNPAPRSCCRTPGTGPHATDCPHHGEAEEVMRSAIKRTRRSHHHSSERARNRRPVRLLGDHELSQDHAPEPGPLAFLVRGDLAEVWIEAALAMEPGMMPLGTAFAALGAVMAHERGDLPELRPAFRAIIAAWGPTPPRRPWSERS